MKHRVIPAALGLLALMASGATTLRAQQWTFG